MNKQSLVRWAGQLKAGVIRRSPEILTGIGIAGMITTTVLAVKATPKAIRLMDEASNEKNDELTTGEKIKAAWKPYIPAAITGAMSVTCLIGANSVNARRNAALAAAYTLSDTALREYKEKVVETIGEKKEQVVRDKIADDKLKNNPMPQNQVVIDTTSEVLCYDSISGRYFKSSRNELERIKNELNSRIFHDMYISLNELYDELGLPHISVGDDLGWNTDDLIDLDLNGRLNEDGSLCIVLDYRVAPKYNYDRMA